MKSSQTEKRRRLERENEVFLEEEYKEDGAQENSKYGDGICDVHLETFEK